MRKFIDKINKIVIVSGMFAFTTLSSLAQTGAQFNPSDSSFTTRGVLTNKALIHMRDSIGGKIDYWQNQYSIVGFDRLKSSFNDGTINGGIVWVDANGLLKRSPTIPSTYITGLSNPVYNYNVSRVITSTSFTPSSTQAYSVRYAVNISCNSTLLNSASGKIELQYYNGSTWITVDEATVSVSGVLATNGRTVAVAGEFPPNTQLRLVSTTTNATNTYVRGSEILR